MAKLALILLAAFYLTSNLYAVGPVMQSKKLPTEMFSGSEIHPTEMFIDADNRTFIIIRVSGRYGGTFLYVNDSLTDPEMYVGVGNGFITDGHFHFVLWKDRTISIYKVEKDIELVSRIGIADSSSKFLRSGDIERVITVSRPGNSYYLLGSHWRLPAHPVELVKTILSWGHGVSYRKPFLAEVRDDKILKYRKLRYGGKIDESYYIRQVVPCGDLVHFLGFRMQEEPALGPSKKESKPVMLHHAAYDLKKKKVIQNHTIYTDTPKTDKDSQFFYEPLSMDAMGNDVFVAFSWAPERLQPRPVSIKDIKSTIFYWQYSNGIASDVEKIAEGLFPIVKVDSIGNAHLFWVNDKSNLMHRSRRKGLWQKESVLVEKIDAKPYIKNIAASFDKDDTLHVVYSSGGNPIHSVIKLD